MKTLPHFHASTLLLAAIAAMAVGPLAVGQTDCPEQEFPPMTGYSVTLDPNQIALTEDPNGVMRPLPLRVMTVTVGQIATDKIRACDPDGDPISVHCQDGVLAAEPNQPEHYRWSWTPTAVGVTYHWIEATDERPVTSDALTVRGTIVVVAIPKNRPPVLCGGQP